MEINTSTAERAGCAEAPSSQLPPPAQTLPCCLDSHRLTPFQERTKDIPAPLAGLRGGGGRKRENDWSLLGTSIAPFPVASSHLPTPEHRSPRQLKRNYRGSPAPPPVVPAHSSPHQPRSRLPPCLHQLSLLGCQPRQEGGGVKNRRLLAGSAPPKPGMQHRPPCAKGWKERHHWQSCPTDDDRSVPPTPAEPFPLSQSQGASGESASAVRSNLLWNPDAFPMRRHLKLLSSPPPLCNIGARLHSP